MGENTYQHLRVTSDQGIVVLTITEPNIQDESLAATLREEMLNAVTDSGVLNVVVDFQYTRTLSSMAFRPLLTLRRSLQEKKGQLVLCGLSPAVGDIFYTTKLISKTGEMTALFEVAPDVPTAIARLAGAVPQQ